MRQGVHASRNASCATLWLLVVAVWIATFAVSRMHMLWQAYSDLNEVRDDESWLLQQCRADEFYSKMKQHSALCDEVAHKAKDVLVLKALHHVIDNSYLCGYDPCTELLDRMVTWALGRGIMFTSCVVLVMVMGPVLLFPVYRRQLHSMQEERARALYHSAYDKERCTIQYAPDVFQIQH